jgi:excisionase family DNA binding protein
MKTDTNPLSVLDPLLSINELAEYLGVPIKTIYEWRQSGRGPVGIRMGRHLKFAVSDVRALGSTRSASRSLGGGSRMRRSG